MKLLNDLNNGSILKDRKLLANLNSLLGDGIATDADPALASMMASLSPKALREMKLALNVLLKQPDIDKSSDLLNNAWRMTYHTKPPTPEEFLTEKYLGASASSVRPYIREVFLEYFDPNPARRKQTLVLYPHTGWGKCHPRGTRVLTPTGHIRIEDIKPGDRILGTNRSTQIVQQVEPTNQSPHLITLELRDGRRITSTPSHRYPIILNGQRVNMEASAIQRAVADNRQIGLWTDSEPVAFASNTDNIFKLNLTPYFLGVLLGSSGDNLLEANLNLQAYTQNLGGVVPITNTSTILNTLKILELFNIDDDSKRIPKQYLIDDIPSRTDLLRGILDVALLDAVDGVCLNIKPFGGLFIEDLKSLIRSLGGVAWLDQIHFRGDSIQTLRLTLPFDLKTPRMKIKGSPSLVSVVRASRVANELCYHIEVSNQDHLYVVNDFIWTHNSYLTSLINSYVATHMCYMHSPTQTFGISSISEIYQLLIAITQGKARELLLAPIENMLDASPAFEKFRIREGMYASRAAQLAEFGHLKTIPYTTARLDDSVRLSFAGAGKTGPHIKLISETNKILGLTVITAVATEIAFFKGVDGWTDERIDELRTKTLDRINSRMDGAYLSRFVIDSSPNNLESSTDRWINEVAKYDPNVLMVSGSRWKFARSKYEAALPYLYKNPSPGDFVDHQFCFPVFKGASGRSPHIVADTEVPNYSPQDLIWVPKESSLITSFSNNTHEALKDDGGLPAGSAQRIFSDKVLVEAVFDERLRSMESKLEFSPHVMPHIMAPANQSPDRLIWSQIVSKFFVKDLHTDRYSFYYKPRLARVVSVDQSVSKDVTAISVLHVEKNPSGSVDDHNQPIYTSKFVVDALICLVPGKDNINLMAIIEFIMDLKRIGNMNIAGVSFDQFQSVTGSQMLEREGFVVKRVSVDQPSAAYEDFISIVESGMIVSGRSLHLKNNMLGLQWGKTREGRKKADHPEGQLVLDGPPDWDTSMIGSNAKDALDAVVAGVTLSKLLGLTKNVNELFDPSKLIRRSDEELMARLMDLAQDPNLF